MCREILIVKTKGFNQNVQIFNEQLQRPAFYNGSAAVYIIFLFTGLYHRSPLNEGRKEGNKSPLKSIWGEYFPSLERKGIQGVGTCLCLVVLDSPDKPELSGTQVVER